MAYSSAAISAQELADLALDKPLLGAGSALTSVGGVRWTTTGTFAGTDLTDPDYPAARACDGLGFLPTKPDDTATDTWYLMLRADPTKYFDSVVIVGHNLGTEDSDFAAVDLQIADDDDFGTNLLTVTGWVAEGITSKRLVSLSLVDAEANQNRRFTGVEYVRVKFSVGVEFERPPEVSDVILFRRRQLRYGPDKPFDPGLGRVSEAADVYARSGAGTRYLRHRGRRDFVAMFNPDNSGSPDDITSLDTLWKTDANHGEHPVIWIQKPYSASGAALIGNGPTIWDFPTPEDQPYSRLIEFPFREVAPLYSGEE